MELKVSVTHAPFVGKPSVHVEARVEHENSAVAQALHEESAKVGARLAESLLDCGTETTSVQLMKVALAGAAMAEEDKLALDKDDLRFIHNMFSRPGHDASMAHAIQRKIALMLVGPPETYRDTDYVVDSEDEEREVEVEVTDARAYQARGREAGLRFPVDFSDLYRQEARGREALRVLEAIRSNADVMEMLRTSYAENGYGSSTLDLLLHEALA